MTSVRLFPSCRRSVSLLLRHVRHSTLAVRLCRIVSHKSSCLPAWASRMNTAALLLLQTKVRESYVAMPDTRTTQFCHNARLPYPSARTYHSLKARSALHSPEKPAPLVIRKKGIFLPRQREKRVCHMKRSKFEEIPE